MIPTFMDLETGERGEGSDWPVYWWTEGNGSCDCNRAIQLGKHAQMFDRQHLEHPELRKRQQYCLGCKRFIAIAVHGDLEGQTALRIIRDMNRNYPI